MTALRRAALAAVPCALLAGYAAGQCELSPLLAGDAAPEDAFGAGVSLDGTRAAVSGGGAVYLFEEVAGSWQPVTWLAAEDGAWLTGVALRGDRLLAGAPNGHGATANSGSAYLFERTPLGWRQTAEMFAADGAWDDGFGESVAIDGDVAVVGAWIDEFYTGAAYVFERGASGWVEAAKLTASDGDFGDFFAISVSLAGDRVVAGCPRTDTTASDGGAAYVFERTSSGWFETAKVTAPAPETASWFGFAVLVSGDTLLAGAPQEAGTAPVAGAVHVFEHTAGIWTETDRWIDQGGQSSELFGSALALDGDRAAVGATSAVVHGAPSGSVHVFEKAGGTWSHALELQPVDPAVERWFGVSVGVSGGVVVGGAPGDDARATDAGAAFLFDLDVTGEVSNYCVSVPNSTGFAATIGFEGAPSLGGGFTLVADGCPSFEHGVFFYGAGQTSVPYANGFLCVDGMLFRLPDVATGALGHVAYAPDFGHPPHAAGQVTAGSTWSFQLWYRDPGAGGAQSNLSDALRATFCP